MGKITALIDDNLEKELRLEIVRRKNRERGHITEAIEEAIRLWLKEGQRTATSGEEESGKPPSIREFTPEVNSFLSKRDLRVETGNLVGEKVVKPTANNLPPEVRSLLTERDLMVLNYTPNTPKRKDPGGG
jgi:hypothetical protein